jgi:hypothetical protein
MHFGPFTIRQANLADPNSILSHSRRKLFGQPTFVNGNNATLVAPHSFHHGIRGKNEACLTAYCECNWPVHFLHTGDRSSPLMFS